MGKISLFKEKEQINKKCPNQDIICLSARAVNILDRCIHLRRDASWSHTGSPPLTMVLYQTFQSLIVSFNPIGNENCFNPSSRTILIIDSN